MNLLRTSMLFSAVVASATCWACSDGTVGIGEDNPQAAKTGLAAYAGSWDGYVEALTFEGGISDRVRLVMDEQGKGNIRLGERELIAKPTDPDVTYYPPQEEFLTFAIDAVPPFVFEGFNYPLQGSIVESARIRTGASSAEIHRDLCAIQTAPYPYRNYDRTYAESGDLFVAAWDVGYSMTPVTSAGVAMVDGVASVVVFDEAPITVAQLTTNTTHSYPYVDFYTGTEPVAAFNLLHPDHPYVASNPVESKRGDCARNADGSYTLSPEAAQISDIKLDGALENQANTIVGSLAVPSRELGRTYVRTVRLTRVQ